MSMARVRNAAVAGSFYDSDPEHLRREVDFLLNEEKALKLKGIVRGLVSPHAGYMYSGSVAAAGYRILEGLTYEAVFLVGPSHREYFNGVSIYPGDAYQTPLGQVPVNKEFRTALMRQSANIQLSEAGHRAEHCLEVQLPFLQRVLGDFSIVPMIMGNQTKEFSLSLGYAISVVAKKRNVLLVASTDLSHYHPYDDAVKLDQQVVNHIASFDERALLDQMENERLEACGGGPLAAVMHASKLLGANRSHVLLYSNSGDVTGDKSAVVGYCSAAFLQTN
jgi:AmmeMemoRadiSam system protein B